MDRRQTDQDANVQWLKMVSPSIEVPKCEKMANKTRINIREKGGGLTAFM